MPEYRVRTCPLCDTPVEAIGFSPGTGPATAGKNGFLVTVGFSQGGWGQRRDALDWSGEICRPCFAKVMELAKPLAEFLHARQEPGRESPFKKTVRALGFSR